MKENRTKSVFGVFASLERLFVYVCVYACIHISTHVCTLVCTYVEVFNEINAVRALLSDHPYS